jgi:hypothetical protein
MQHLFNIIVYIAAINNLTMCIADCQVENCWVDAHIDMPWHTLNPKEELEPIFEENPSLVKDQTPNWNCETCEPIS